MSQLTNNVHPQPQSPKAQTAPIPVIEVLASGPAKGGGIGQVVRFLLQENAANPVLDVVATVDPRGPGHWAQTFWYLPMALFHLTALRLTKGRTPVLHVHIAGRLSTLRKTIAIAWAHLLGFPVAVHYHEYGYAKFFHTLPGPARAWVALILRHCRAHIVLGPAEKQNLPQILGADPARFHVIPNGVPKGLTDVARSAPASPMDIVFVGALSDRKGVPELIAATAMLPPELPWRLVFCGPGDLAERKARAAAAGIAERCLFLGMQDNQAIQKRLPASAIFCLPSHAEGFAIALLEAMAAGTAIIATEVGEQKQALRHKDNALVVPPGDVEALRAALLELLTDAQLRDRLGASARADVAHTFNTATMLQSVAEVMRAVANERRFS
jgi:glycosyltransferase involved in cell wall biosynthesis